MNSTLPVIFWATTECVTSAIQPRKPRSHCYFWAESQDFNRNVELNKSFIYSPLWSMCIHVCFYSVVIITCLIFDSTLQKWCFCVAFFLPFHGGWGGGCWSVNGQDFISGVGCWWWSQGFRSGGGEWGMLVVNRQDFVSEGWCWWFNDLWINSQIQYVTSVKCLLQLMLPCCYNFFF